MALGRCEVACRLLDLGCVRSLEVLGKFEGAVLVRQPNRVQAVLVRVPDKGRS